MNPSSIPPVSTQGAPPLAGADGPLFQARAEVRSVPVPPRPKIVDPPKPRIEFDPSVIRKNLQAAIEELNKQMANSGRNLGFSVDHSVTLPIVTVKNTSTGEVVRQIPSEAIVSVAHTFDRLKGLLHDATT